MFGRECFSWGICNNFFCVSSISRGYLISHMVIPRPVLFFFFFFSFFFTFLCYKFYGDPLFLFYHGHVLYRCYSWASLVTIILPGLHHSYMGFVFTGFICFLGPVCFTFCNVIGGSRVFNFLWLIVFGIATAAKISLVGTHESRSVMPTGSTSSLRSEGNPPQCTQKPVVKGPNLKP